MKPKADKRQSLASLITKEASKQTYYTIRFFVDRDRVADAFRAYAYFRWVDDVLDTQTGTACGKITFALRQQCLLDALYRDEYPDGLCNVKLCAEERMLADLVQHDDEKDSGLQAYLRNMMAVMAFDARRRGKLISQVELVEYSRMLATAVTEAMYYFIGHDDPSPNHEARYLAVTAAHITHMLRDTYEDIEAGYFNIPREVLQMSGISPWDINSRAYQDWVYNRVQLAHRYFKEGRECIVQVKNLRCRLAGFAYLARFEWVLRMIECDHFRLRGAYPERKSLEAGLWMGWSTLVSIFASPIIRTRSQESWPYRSSGVENR